MSVRREDIYIVVHDPRLASEELDRIREAKPEYGEIWVERGQPRICALIAGSRAWLMYLRHEGDEGFSTRNPDVSSSDDVSFRLSNGQIDRYPLAWTYPTDDVLNALETFAVSGLVPRNFRWHNNSEDGTSSPNDAAITR